MWQVPPSQTQNTLYESQIKTINPTIPVKQAKISSIHQRSLHFHVGYWLIGSQIISEQCFWRMQRKNPSDVREQCNLSSQGDDCITFISLSHYEMHKLVHDQDHFVNKVQAINNQAKRKIDVGAYKQALTLLAQGEKILQYAAGSGKTIERDLIICVLHNIASAYHKLWVLDKCLSYVEGLMFNLENHLSSLQNSVMSSSQKQEAIVAAQGLEMKHFLTTYSIRFCALNSQQSNHKQALASARKAVSYIRSVLTFDERLIRSLFQREKESEYRTDLKYRLLMEVLDFQGNINVKKHKDVLKAAHFSVQIWNKNKQKSNNHAYLKNYSIGDFMDIKARQYRSKGQKLSPEQERQRDFEASIIYKLLLLSISYFSLSTEMRLNVSETQYYSQIQKETGFHYKQAELYHLLAIIVGAAFFDFEILYLKHVLNSYANYFNSSLTDYKTVEPESLQKVLQLLTDSYHKSIVPGSTQIISEECLPDTENNQYRLKDKCFEKARPNRLKQPKKKCERLRSNSKNFSSLESKSIIKEDKLRLKGVKPESKQKSKSKPKSKSKTLEKKSKEKESNYYFVVKTSKSKKKISEQLCTISKKLSPKKSKQHYTIKQAGSQILPKSQKKSILGQKVVSKRLLMDNRSPKKKNNIYGLQF